jgi:hypothetical protein
MGLETEEKYLDQVRKTQEIREQVQTVYYSFELGSCWTQVWGHICKSNWLKRVPMWVSLDTVHFPEPVNAVALAPKIWKTWCSLIKCATSQLSPCQLCLL